MSDREYLEAELKAERYLHPKNTLINVSDASLSKEVRMYERCRKITDLPLDYGIMRSILAGHLDPTSYKILKPKK
jgi:hypothetical protein